MLYGTVVHLYRLYELLATAAVSERESGERGKGDQNGRGLRPPQRATPYNIIIRETQY